MPFDNFTKLYKKKCADLWSWLPATCGGTTEMGIKIMSAASIGLRSSVVLSLQRFHAILRILFADELMKQKMRNEKKSYPAKY